MTEQELIEARELVAYFRGRRLLPDIDTPLPFRDQIPVLPKMLDSLLKAIDERDAIIHDLQQDGEAMHERIRQAERREVVNCLHYLLQRKRKQRKAVDLFDIETQIIGCRGLVGNPLPPDQARAEADRLRGVLADLVSGCGSHSCKVKRPAGVGVNGPCRCVDKLVQLVEE